MARIPQRFIDDLLDRVDIVDVVDRRVKLKKTGKNFSACCPFHDEKTPSFSVNPEKQFYYCFGCGATGNAIGFIMDYERRDFPEVVEMLAQSVGMEVPREEARPGEAPKQDSNRPLYEQLEQTTRFYEQALRKHGDAKRAVDYLKSRGLSGEIARDFRLGFAPPGWSNLMDALGKEPEQQKLLMESGMLVKNDRNRTYDRFRDRIVFPILDARGRVIAFGGRVLGDDKPKYLNSPETPVFHKSRELYGLYQARKSGRSLNRIVVVEGYMDVIALAQFGIGYAVATLGTATSEQHVERLFRHVSEVVFCFDGDAAGAKAAFRALESALPAMQDGRQARFLFLPDGEDPDTLIRAKGQQHLEHLFDTATPLETFLFDHLADGLDLTALDGRARFSKLAAPFLHRLPEGVFKVLMYQALADKTGIDVDSLKRLQAPPPEAASGDGRRDGPTPTTAPSSADSGRLHHGSRAGAGGDFSGMPSPPEGFMEHPPDDYPPEAFEPAAFEPAAFETGAFDAAPGPEGRAEDYPGDGSPAEHDSQSLMPSPSNPVHRLLGLLVLNPSLGAGIDADTLPQAETADSQLLREVVARLQRESASTASLMGFWFGTPEGDLLTELAGREPLEDDAGQRALAEALVRQLINEDSLKTLRAEYNTLKQSEYSKLDADQKRRMMALTREIRSLTGRV